MMMSRRFLHLVACTGNRRRPAYTLHLIDPSTFFQSRSGGDGTATTEDFHLPAAAMSFYRPGLANCPVSHDMDFVPIGRGCNTGILALDHMGRTTHYDPVTPAISTIPALHGPKIMPISFPAGDSVYLMNMTPGYRHCFEALVHGLGRKSRPPTDWYWHSLPPPPHVRPPTYVPYDSDASDDEYAAADEPCIYSLKAYIDGHMVVGGSQIWISTRGASTYSFDTVSGDWSNAMDWKLPFRGCAEYVPELGLRFGFSSQDNCLCAIDLAATASAMTPPVLRGAWEDLAHPNEWEPVISCIVPLGSGKLYLAKFFETKDKVYMKCGDWIYGNYDNFTVFTGVELLEKPGGGLRMVKHKSKRYTHQCEMPDWFI
ncbi:hypothetical protein ACQ4PT_054402 [Festuca glaucescens]